MADGRDSRRGERVRAERGEGRYRDYQHWPEANQDRYPGGFGLAGRRGSDDFGRHPEVTEDYYSGDYRGGYLRARDEPPFEGYGREMPGGGYGRGVYGREAYGDLYGEPGPGTRYPPEPYGGDRAGYGRGSVAEHGQFEGERYGPGWGIDYAGGGRHREIGSRNYATRVAEEQRGPHRGRGPRGYTRSDDRIREDVCDRLTEDSHVDASDVEVTVSGAEVTLDGTVDEREAKRRAEDVADFVTGVTHVQNNLRIRGIGADVPPRE